MNRRSALLFLISALPLGACVQPVLHTGSLNDQPEGQQPEGPCILAGGDRVRVIVFGQDNLSNSYLVDTEGRIAVPLIGSVRVAGGTAQQAARTIEAGLRNGFIREPQVTVDIEAYRPFFILGEVLNPGQYPYASGMSAQTAVAIAGGFTPRARKNQAELTRPGPEGLITSTVPITSSVRPGDTIVIKERWF